MKEEKEEAEEKEEEEAEEEEEEEERNSVTRRGGKAYNGKKPIINDTLGGCSRYFSIKSYIVFVQISVCDDFHSINVI